MADSDQFIILGAGISGLYTGLVLVEKGYGQNVTIIAKNLPGDIGPEYVSPMAGAHYSSRVFGNDPRDLEWNQVTYHKMKELFKDHGESSGIRPTVEMELYTAGTEPLESTMKIIRDLDPHMHVFDDKSFLESHGATYGHEFASYNWNPTRFLLFLQQYLCKHGVTFHRKTIDHIDDAYAPSTKVVFNCTGLGASRIQGIHDDKKSFPVRGHVVVVRAPHITKSIGLALPHHESIYLVPRPYTNGLVIVGGTREVGNASVDMHVEQSQRLLSQALEFWPDLSPPGKPLEIIGPSVGLRPGREGGARVAADKAPNGRYLIHNYGVNGAGYQAGYGLASSAVALYLDSIPKEHL